MIEAAFKAFAKALDEATSMDPRITDVLSTKEPYKMSNEAKPLNSKMSFDEFKLKQRRNVNRCCTGS